MGDEGTTTSENIGGSVRLTGDGNTPAITGPVDGSVRIYKRGDANDPTMTCPADVVANISDNGMDDCTTSVNLGSPVVDDNCSVATVVAQVNGTDIDPGSYAFGAVQLP